METYTRSLQSQQIPQGREIQNGDARNNKDLPPGRGVGNIHQFQGCIFLYTHSEPVQEIPKISHPGSDLSVQSPTLWSVHSTHGVHSSDQRGQTDGLAEGYKDPAVPRRLVGPYQIPSNLSPAYTDSSSSLSGTRLDSQHREIRTGPQTSFRLRQLPVQLERGQGQTHPRPAADTHNQYCTVLY